MNSSRPYLVRAIYEWITDNNMTPYVVIDTQTPGVQVPERYIQDNRIILNVSPGATQKLLINNERIEFDARFAEAIWHICAPVSAILAIYARENGRGMVFEEDLGDEDAGSATGPINQPTDSPPKSKPTKPNLKIVK